MTKSKEQSFIVTKTGKLVLEVSSRKKARRVARRKYSKEYSVEKSYIIVSGSNLKEALQSLKKEIANRTKEKKVSLSKKTVKKAVGKKVAKNKKAVSKSKNSKTMLTAAIKEESKKLARLNKKNFKD